MDLLGKILTTPGLTPPLIVLCVICFGAGGYFMWSLAFYKTHRNMVRCEDFDRYVEEWHTFRANTQAEMADLRKDFSDEMREMNKNVVALVREMKADLSAQMERSYEVLDGKAEKIDKSYHAFKDSLQGFQLYYNRKMLGLKGDE